MTEIPPFSHDTIAVLDFGSQYTQVIARRVREARVRSVVLPFSVDVQQIRALSPKGLILSGGPASVYEEGGPQAQPEILKLDIPVLGLCYGMQWMARTLGGTVGMAAQREYGRTLVRVEPSDLFHGLAKSQTVWMSHGDHVESLPPGFEKIAESDNAPVAGMAHLERRLFALQFHPEVHHTENGMAILENFLFDICKARPDWTMSSFLAETVSRLRTQIDRGVVLGALSGGVDSTVTAVLLKEAIGERFHGVFVDTGLLRKNEGQAVLDAYRHLGLEVRGVDASEKFFSELSGVSDPEQKRKIIGRLFIDVFTEHAARESGAEWLAQGTLYPDVIESVSVKGPSSVIKTHHNVGGLPEKLGFKLVEPLRELFKDEVRRLGRELGIPESLLSRHPFPGPGLAVRIPGEITREKVATLQDVDAIFLEELRAHGAYELTSQAFAVLLPVKSVGVMGDNRTYQSVVALRAVTTQDFMTADWARLPHDLLDRAARRIVNEVKGVNRVVYDITSKPPGTIEWE